jgi:Domain of unknown function (DUF4157)
MARAEHAHPVRRGEQAVAAPTQQPTTAPATLTVGHAFDPAEHEADRVADAVIARLRDDGAADHVPSGADRGEVRRAAAPSATKPVVGMEGGALPGELTQRIEGKRGGGQPLAPGVRSRMEGAFGTSLADVRIHADQESATLNRSISARAFTTGRDVFFGAGEYRPDTPDGEHMLAHELAHTRQQAGVRRIHRTWDFAAEKLDWTKARSMRTLKSRFVWFVEDDQGEDVVVKLENQPVGLAELTAKMHSKLGTAASVKQKTLTGRDQAWISGMLQDPQVAGGTSWADFATANSALPAPPLQPGQMDAANAEDYGRGMALHELRNSPHQLIAMTKAKGITAEEASKPTAGGNAGATVSVLRNRLADKAHTVQLGRITAVDLFLGNTDRVFRGNMGNWFYDPKGAITLIDHVDQGTNEALKFAAGNEADWELNDNAGGRLKTANLAATVTDALDQIAREANYHGDKAVNGVPGSGFKGWLKEDLGGQTRREQIEGLMLKGLREERAKLIKVFTATSKLDRLKTRSTKKSLKKAAGKANAADQGHAEFRGAATDYWSTMKSRALWLKAN